MSLEEQLRNDAQSLREVGWFNRAIMMDAAANEIQKLNERIKRLEEAGDELGNNHNPFTYIDWLKAKEAKL
jgi:archaellum component FlaC